MYVDSRFLMPTPMAVFGIRVRARVGPQQLVPDEHRPRRAYETTNKQNPRPTSVEQQPRGARAASYGEGAASEDSSATRGGPMYGKVAHSSSLFRGRTCAARGRAGTALRGFFVAAAKSAKQKQPQHKKLA